MTEIIHRQRVPCVPFPSPVPYPLPGCPAPSDRLLRPKWILSRSVSILNRNLVKNSRLAKQRPLRGINLGGKSFSGCSPSASPSSATLLDCNHHFFHPEQQQQPANQIDRIDICSEEFSPRRQLGSIPRRRMPFQEQQKGARGFHPARAPMTLVYAAEAIESM